ncbi:MAG: hypothetical protein RQ885_05530 [Desulfurococcales archaeon]|nr:hypothetical protein [Desulfurococcales archaeon]
MVLRACGSGMLGSEAIYAIMIPNGIGRKPAVRSSGPMIEKKRRSTIELKIELKSRKG